MEFKRYTHVENCGRDEVEGIEVGTTYIFPKLDGANASIWWDPTQEILRCGSRSKELHNPTDLQGFWTWVHAKENWPPLIDFFKVYPYYRLYGEWLVPHTLKTYQEDAWRKFYIFDVYYDQEDRYMGYEDYKELLEEFELEYVPCLKEIKNGDHESFVKIVTQDNTFLIKDGEGVGEGIVIKNYEYRNKYGRQCFAKLKTNDFLAKHSRTMGHPVTEKHPMAEKLVEELLSVDTIRKVLINMTHGETDQFESRDIPRLLETIFHDFVIEETYEACKRYKLPTIDFKMLKKFVNIKIKATIPEAFGGIPLNKGY